MSEERETTRIFRPCGATLQMGYGQFLCQMSPHDGRHSAEGKQDGHFFFIMWEGDMKGVCEPIAEPILMNPT